MFCTIVWLLLMLLFSSPGVLDYEEPDSLAAGGTTTSFWLMGVVFPTNCFFSAFSLPSELRDACAVASCRNRDCFLLTSIFWGTRLLAKYELVLGVTFL